MGSAMFVAPHHAGRTQKRGYSIPQISSRFVDGEQTATASLVNTLFRDAEFRRGFFRRFPEVAFQVHPGLDDGDAFAFEEFSLQGCVRLADQDSAPFTKDTMPRNTFSGGSCGHGATRAARAAGKTQGFSQGP